MASKHGHIQVLEVNNVVLRPLLVYLDFVCVCCIHTIVRMVVCVGCMEGSHPYL